MISVSRINGEVVFINPDLVRYIESCPDTLITFMDGKTLIVQQSPDDIQQKILAYRRAIHTPTPQVQV